MAGAKFINAFYALLPSWLVEDEQEKVNFSLTLIMDGFLERLYQGVAAPLASVGTETALSLIGRDRKITRGFAEPAETYRERLVRWLDDHKIRGGPRARMAQLWAYLNPYRVMLRNVADNESRSVWDTLEAGFEEDDDTDTADAITRDVRSGSDRNWNWDGTHTPKLWSRFWTIVYPTTSTEPLFDDGVEFGNDSEFGDGRTLGSSASWEQIQTLRAMAAFWKGAHAAGQWLILAFDPDSFDPELPPTTTVQDLIPDGNWGDWSRREVIGDPGPGDPILYRRVPSRLETARYVSLS